MKSIPGFVELHVLRNSVSEPVWIAVSAIVRFEDACVSDTIKLGITDGGNSQWIWARGSITELTEAIREASLRAAYSPGGY